MKHRPILAILLVAAATLGPAACGDEPSADRDTSSEPVVVSAAASLQAAFTAYGDEFDDGAARFSFAGSDALAAQIRQGVRPDVFAAANTALPDELFEAGLVERPVVFAQNRLVLAVPSEPSSGDGPQIDGLEDLEDADVSIAVGSDAVPIGSYTRKVLGRLPAAERRRILANVRTQEPDVKGIVGKLTQGAVDAGFVYITDVAASKGALRAIELPEALRPSAAYGVAVVKDAEHPRAARAFVEGLVADDGAGRRALAAAGFEPPPR